MVRHYPKLVETMDYGRIVASGRRSYHWVPESEYPGSPPNKEELEGLPKFKEAKQARLWGRLMELDPSYQEVPVEFPEETAEAADKESIPVNVAREGKAAMAAYLYAVGHTYGVDRALDVSERTVEQYLSDYKRGAR